ncbi:Flagellar_C1a complex subunit C1a-32 [Hexamita inflata]|uniref:Putative n=1 Tax=Hexamita inflata TaxID=28002 RepID=A0AA86QWK4_9EUKA|nr:Flagellar C1a complex subunit C1a-32 [Hexamita inflata]
MLYIQPDELEEKLIDNVDATIEQYFGVQSNSRNFVVLQELLQNLQTFGRQNLSQSAICALFTCQTDMHQYNISQAEMTFIKLQSYTTDLVNRYSLELPPLYKAAVNSFELPLFGTFLQTYLINYKLYRYLFKPLNLLKVRTLHQIDVTKIESLSQLGVQPQPIDPKDKNKPKTPVEQSRQSRAEVPKRAFNVTLLPLSQAQLYVKPPEPTVQEIRTQEINSNVEQIKTAEPEINPEKKVDVEKFTKVIELQVEQELEKIKAKIVGELQGKKK